MTHSNSPGSSPVLYLLNSHLWETGPIHLGFRSVGEKLSPPRGLFAYLHFTREAAQVPPSTQRLKEAEKLQGSLWLILGPGQI